MADDGKIDQRVAYLYLQKEDWKNSAAALKRAKTDVALFGRSWWAVLGLNQ